MNGLAEAMATAAHGATLGEYIGTLRDGLTIEQSRHARTAGALDAERRQNSALRKYVRALESRVKQLEGSAK